MSTSLYRRKSFGLGCSTEAPPKKFGCRSCNPSADQQPVDAPSTRRAYGWRISRTCSAIYGINSSTTASPYGPVLAELTEYPSGKYGVCCWKLMAMNRGKESAIQDR